MFMWRYHWVAYHDETNRETTEKQADKQRAKFKHRRDLSPFARVSYSNYTYKLLTLLLHG